MEVITGGFMDALFSFYYLYQACLSLISQYPHIIFWMVSFVIIVYGMGVYKENHSHEI